VPFDVFWSNKIEKYEQHNIESKNFFKQFTSNRLSHGGTCRYLAIGASSSPVLLATKDGSSSSIHVVSPTVEIIDLTEDAKHKYIYKRPR
jgi:hypothetical protein